MDRVFRKQIDKGSFYNVIKQRVLTSEDLEDKKKVAKAKFYERSGGHNHKQVIKYDLLEITNNTLFWSNKKVTEKQCIAMSEYLKELKDVKEV